MPLNVLYKVDENGKPIEAPERDTPRLVSIPPKYMRFDGVRRTFTERWFDTETWDRELTWEDRTLMLSEYLRNVVTDPLYKLDKQYIKQYWFEFERQYVPDPPKDYSDQFAKFE